MGSYLSSPACIFRTPCPTSKQAQQRVVKTSKHIRNGSHCKKGLWRHEGCPQGYSPYLPGYDHRRYCHPQGAQWIKPPVAQEVRQAEQPQHHCHRQHARRSLQQGAEGWCRQGVFEQPKGPSGGTKLAKKKPATEKKPAAKKETATKKEPAKKPAAK